MNGGDAGSARRRQAWPEDVPSSGELVARLNAWWRVAGPEPARATFKQRLLRPVRSVLARLLAPQETFNSALVQYINGLSSSHALTLDRWEAALDEVQRYRDALAARERRMDAGMAAIRAQHDELRTSVNVLQQAAHNLKRDLERRIADAARSPGALADAAANTPEAGEPSYAAASGPAREGHALSHKYVGFEDQFRGAPETIRAGLAEYVPLFAGTADVLDVGCGRGEFLALLREHGVRARGIDVNDAMVDVCRDKGLDATVADALAYVRAVPDASLGGLFAAQVVEHLEPGYLTQLLDAAFEKLAPGAPIVLETINPACWFAFFESYVRDITHVRPLHPDTLRFLLVATGFHEVDVRYRAPYPEHEKLQPIPATGGLADSVETLNANVEKINRLLFTHLDYAAIARR